MKKLDVVKETSGAANDFLESSIDFFNGNKHGLSQPRLASVSHASKDIFSGAYSEVSQHSRVSMDTSDEA